MINPKPYHNRSMYKGAPASSFVKARILRQNMTIAEKALWECLKNKQFENLKFRRQHPLHIYIVDFYCHELGLIIEIDGEYHNEVSQIQKDLDRTELLKFQNLHLIRFTNDAVVNSLGKVLDELKQYVTKLSPRSK